MTRPLLAAALSLALLVGVAPGAPRAQTAPAQPETPAPTIAESHLAVAREVVETSGLERSFEAVIPQFQEGILRQYASTAAGGLDLVTQVLVDLRPEMELQRRAMVNRAARVMAARLSEAELTEIAAFFRTDAGRRYVETQPQVLDGLISEMQVWSQELGEYLQVRVQAELLQRAQNAQQPARPAQ